MMEEAGGVARAAGPRSWGRHARALKQDLAKEIPPRLFADLSRKRPWRHFSVLARQSVLLGFLAWATWHFTNPWVWIPLALLQGLTLFDFTVLLHEVVHALVWPGGRGRRDSVLAWIYALPSGISPTQFRRWHLDHHSGLGSDTEDPKRHRLSPRINARWLKALYFTPALFPIYFRAAARETATYPSDLRRRIRRERVGGTLFHLGLAVLVLGFFGPIVLSRVYLVPYLFGFPLAFGLNRLGQHYDIDPAAPERWGTRMRRSRFWDAAFLWSAYHIEHHYFPSVPFYNLRRLNGYLEPFFERRRIPARSYSWLLFQYLVRNRQPHTRWE